MNISELTESQIQRVIRFIEEGYNQTIAEKVVALAKHLDLSVKETLSEIELEPYGNDNYFSYSSQEYLVLTDEEADEREREYVEELIDDCYLAEYEREERKTGRSNPLLQYLDKDKWIEDWCGNRGENLSRYDGVENAENVNDTWYYIYRTN